MRAIDPETARDSRTVTIETGTFGAVLVISFVDAFILPESVARHLVPLQHTG